MFFKLLSKFESLIYFSHRLNFHIQGEALHNGRILEGTLLLVFLPPLIWKFLTKYGNINKIFHSDKFSADNKCQNRFVFKSEFNSPAKVLA